MASEESEPKFPGFPYEPYSIQLDFMKALYRSLDEGGVSMLESPTGTGKTLSIICSALQWVYDQRLKQNSKTNQSEQNRSGSDDDEPDWMRDFVANKDDKSLEKKVNKKIGLKNSHTRRNYSNRASIKELYSRATEIEHLGAKREKSDGVAAPAVEDEEEFLLEEYESEEEGAPKRKVGAVSLGVSSSSSDEGSDVEAEEEKDLKIYFCSRTHSQLSQFVKELRKTCFNKDINVVCLGSRKNFCINQEVLRLGNATRINERCLELQKNKNKQVSKIKTLGAGGRSHRTKASHGCPMLRKHKVQKQFRDAIAQHEAMDIEDLVQLGRNMGACPYYGSRGVVQAADLVVLPYQSLLSASSRESLGLTLKNNIVIIDEAHNLADSLITMYDAKITLSQLEQVHHHIGKYFTRFCSVLGPGNRRYIQTLMVLTQAFLRTLQNEKDLRHANFQPVEERATEVKTAFGTSMAINDFLFSLNIDNINLVKLFSYIKGSNFIQKVSGYGEKLAASQKILTSSDLGENGEEGSVLSSFQAFVEMLVSLTNTDGDGRIIVSRTGSKCSGLRGGFLKYVMLTGEKIFSEIVDQAHAVILAGGTLQPIEETRERLFPRLPQNQLHFFSCNHIVPPEHILPVAVSRGPTGQTFDLSYSSRSSSIMIEELGLLLCNLAAIVPEGIVVFLSSFEYEEQVYNSWKLSGILDRIVTKKHLFREPRRNADVEHVLNEYKEAVDRLSSSLNDVSVTQNGAMLLAVVGGKISEGINFSDGMGRCIVMVGLPYPNPNDIELMERIKYIESLGESNSSKPLKTSVGDEYYAGDIHAAFSVLRSCKLRGKEYYENLCMKAVNQSIGRAIRHINDYAAILLVDKRYTSDPSRGSFSQPTNRLPKWIKGRLVSAANNYGEVHRLLFQFFKSQKNK